MTPSPTTPQGAEPREDGLRNSRVAEEYNERVAAPTNGGGGDTIEARFPALNDHLIRMASTGNTGSLTEWGDFFDCLRAALQPHPTQQGGAERGGLTETENRRVQAALYMVENPSAWDYYDEGASETIRDLCALVERLAALKTEKA